MQMHKSHITFAPISHCKQKRPLVDKYSSDEPPPVLTKGSETEFESIEEPPPPLLEAETSSSVTANDSPFIESKEEPNSVHDWQSSNLLYGEGLKYEINPGECVEDEGTSGEPFLIHNRHLPSWMRNCPKCCIDSDAVFRTHIGGTPGAGPIIRVECFSCDSVISDSQPQGDRRIYSEAAERNDDGPRASTSREEYFEGWNGVTSHQKSAHHFGRNFPVLFKAKGKVVQERITFGGFIYCQISRAKVQTRGRGSAVSHWRCEHSIDKLDSGCAGLVRLEGSKLTVLKEHKHSADYTNVRAMMAFDDQHEFTRLDLVSSGRQANAKSCVSDNAKPAAPFAVLRPVSVKKSSRRITTARQEQEHNGTIRRSGSNETDELIRAITARKELLTVKVTPSPTVQQHH